MRYFFDIEKFKADFRKQYREDSDSELAFKLWEADDGREVYFTSDEEDRWGIFKTDADDFNKGYAVLRVHVNWVRGE